MLKEKLRRVLNHLKIDLTKNLKYDRLTDEILKSNLRESSNCIDVGCHKGEVLDSILKYAPNGTHFAFEPIPSMFNDLKSRYKKNSNVNIFNLALSSSNGVSKFIFVRDNPAYSGLKKRKYKSTKPDLEEITVQKQMLDHVIDLDIKIDFIKIDVEGAEFDVLKGGKELLKKHKPLVLFEFGLGASDYYDTSPSSLYEFFDSLNYEIIDLSSYFSKNKKIQKEELENLYNSNKEYYFVAR